MITFMKWLVRIGIIKKNLIITGNRFRFTRNSAGINNCIFENCTIDNGGVK